MWNKIKEWVGQAADRLIEALDKWFSHLFSWLNDAILWCVHSLEVLLQWTLDAVLLIVLGTLYLLLDGVLIALKAIVYALDFSNVPLQFAAGMGLIPTQAAYFMTVIGFPQFVTIIAAAYAIRLLMNLVPTVAGTGLDKL